MTVEEIKELIKVVNESGIAELEVQRGNDRVRIQRGYPPAVADGPSFGVRTAMMTPGRLLIASKL